MLNQSWMNYFLSLTNMVAQWSDRLLHWWYIPQIFLILVPMASGLAFSIYGKDNAGSALRLYDVTGLDVGCGLAFQSGSTVKKRSDVESDVKRKQKNTQTFNKFLRLYIS